LAASVLTATLLGLFGGLAPGPYTTMVAATGLERGFRTAVPIAMAPLLTDLPPLLVALLVVPRLDGVALSFLGLCGGAVISMVGVRFLRAHRGGKGFVGPLDPKAQSVRLGHVLTTSTLSPAPWIFWFVAGAPLFVIQLRASWPRAAVFLIVLFTVNVGSALTLAWMTSQARQVLAPANRRRILFVAGIALTCTGSFMAWQALEGNFQALIDGQAAIQDLFGRPRLLIGHSA